MSNEKMMKLHPINFGLSVGAVWGLFTVFGAWVAIYGWSTSFVDTMIDTYPGYSASFIGGIIGAVWGFAHGFVKGYLVAYVYNYFGARK